MRIKEAAAKTGLTERTIRFYTEKGLLAPAAEERNGRYFHEYGEADLLALKRCAALRRAGFSIDEIRNMQCDPAVIPALLDQKKRELRTEKARLSELSQTMEALGTQTPLDAWTLADCLSSPKGSLPKPDFSRFDPETREEKDEAYAIFRGMEQIRERRRQRIRPAMRLFLAAAVAAVLFFGAFLLSGIPKSLRQTSSGPVFSLSGTGTLAEAEVTIDGKLYRQWFSQPRFRGTVLVKGWGQPSEESVDLVFDGGMDGPAWLVYPSVVWDREQGEVIPQLRSTAVVWMTADASRMIFQWYVPDPEGKADELTDLVLCVPSDSREDGLLLLEEAGLTESIAQYPAYDSRRTEE